MKTPSDSHHHLLGLYLKYRQFMKLDMSFLSFNVKDLSLAEKLKKRCAPCLNSVIFMLIWSGLFESISSALWLLKTIAACVIVTELSFLSGHEASSSVFTFSTLRSILICCIGSGIAETKLGLSFCVIEITIDDVSKFTQLVWCDHFLFLSPK